MTRSQLAAMTAAITSAFVAGAAHADKPIVLDTIVLTASGREQSLSDVQASVEVIERNRLQSSGASNVTQILRDAVGLNARSSGANESISIRGQKPLATLVLIDGQPRTGKYGGFSLSNFPIEEIERVEIVRGPMSALYGADALGGVVNVITRRPGDSPGKTVSLMTGVRPDDGKRATVRLGASVEFGDDTLGQRLALDLHRQGAYSLPDTVKGDDFSALNRMALSWSGSWMPTTDRELRWRFEAYRQRDERKTFGRGGRPFDALEEEDRASLDLSWAQDLGAGRLTVSGLLSYSKGVAVRSSPIREITHDRKARLQARYDVETGAHNLSLAAGIEHDGISVTGYTASPSESHKFALVQDEWLISDRVAMTVGARVDHYEAFGSTVNPRIVIGSRGDGLTWRLGAGRAFRAPGLSERFARIYRGGGLIIGNPDLKPETSTSYEAAIGWRDATRSIELVYHDSKVKDLITIRRMTPRTISYTNVDEARINGVELTGQWQVNDGLNLSAGLEYLNARDGVTDERLTYRYRTAWRLGATYDIGNWSLNGRLRGIGDYWASTGERGAKPYNSGFTTVDLGATYTMDTGTQISIGLENAFGRAFDKNYSTARYREDGGRFAYIAFRRAF